MYNCHCSVCMYVCVRMHACVGAYVCMYCTEQNHSQVIYNLQIALQTVLSNMTADRHIFILTVLLQFARVGKCIVVLFQWLLFYSIFIHIFIYGTTHSKK